MHQLFVSEPALEKPGLGMSRIRCTEESGSGIDEWVDRDPDPLGVSLAKPLGGLMKANRRGRSPERSRDADVKPLAPREENEQVVVAKLSVSVENPRRKPPGVAQGARQVVFPVDVPMEPVSPTRAAIARLRAVPFQVLVEVPPEREMRQVSFSLGLCSVVACAVGVEGEPPIDGSPPRRTMAYDAKAVGCRHEVFVSFC